MPAKLFAKIVDTAHSMQGWFWRQVESAANVTVLAASLPLPGISGLWWETVGLGSCDRASRTQQPRQPRDQDRSTTLNVLRKPGSGTSDVRHTRCPVHPPARAMLGSTVQSKASSSSLLLLLCRGKVLQGQGGDVKAGSRLAGAEVFTLMTQPPPFCLRRCKAPTVSE